MRRGVGTRAAPAASSSPHRRLAALGPEALSEVELLALLLGVERGGGRAVSRAAALLAQCADARDPSGLTGALGVTPAELAGGPGLGPAAHARLAAAREIARRLAAVSLQPPRRIAGPEDAWRHLAPRLAAQERELFAVMALDRKHAVLRVEVIAVGSHEAVLVHPREVFRTALRAGAAALVVAHNHPSGDPTPSVEDRALTSRLVEAGRLLGVPVLDHLVIGKDGFVSLCREEAA